MTEEQKARRYGNITSSEIVALLSKNKKGDGFGVPALTYIKQTNMERRLGRPLDNEATARALSWGKCCEIVAHDKLPADYTFCAKTTLQHPTISYWLGSPDVTAFDNQVVGDIKCPMTLQAFCEMLDEHIDGNDRIERMTIDACVRNHKHGEKYAAQIISNACITGAVEGHMIVYVPYKKDLDKIRHRAAALYEDGQREYYWIVAAGDDELPWLPDDCVGYRDINVITFDITPEMKQELTDVVTKAGDMLINWPKPLTSLS